MKLEGKVCIVTGAARGIGKAIGMRALSEGARVVFADVNGALAEAAAEEGRAQGGDAIAVQVDVTDRQQVRDLVARTVEEFGKLDIMFNNAGVNRPLHFMDVTRENWDMIMNVNGWGLLVCMQEGARQMIAQGDGGTIVNTASIAGRQGYANIVPYCASKFASISLTQSAARALAPHGIRVNAIAPGVVDTPLWAQLDRQHMELGDSSEPGEAMRNFAAAALNEGIAEPDDIAGLAIFLASPDSAFVIGQTVNVCGGMQLN